MWIKKTCGNCGSDVCTDVVNIRVAFRNKSVSDSNFSTNMQLKLEWQSCSVDIDRLCDANGICPDVNPMVTLSGLDGIVFTANRRSDWGSSTQFYVYAVMEGFSPFSSISFDVEANNGAGVVLASKSVTVSDKDSVGSCGNYGSYLIATFTAFSNGSVTVS